MKSHFDLQKLEVLPLTDVAAEAKFDEELTSKVETAILEGQTGTLEIAATATGLVLFTTNGKGEITNTIHIGANACLGVSRILFNRGRAFETKEHEDAQN